MNEHELEIYPNKYTGGLDGICGCSTMHYEDGWEGQVSFFGNTEEEVKDQHWDHLLEEGVKV